jgi:glycosyltransferase involved in cell wall biosynthesis
LPRDPLFLPNPYTVPETATAKAGKPTVCFLARWDPRKRPERFFELAVKFPHVRFVAMGKAHNDARDRRLREEYGAIPNLEMVGFVDPFTSDLWERILGESWIMVNTAAREGLPAAFVEAAAHKCAILSSLDPDQFASRGGYFAEDGNLAEGLSYLLENDRWRELGERGYAYVKEVHDTNAVVQQHLRQYALLLSGDGGRSS